MNWPLALGLFYGCCGALFLWLCVTAPVIDDLEEME